LTPTSRRTYSLVTDPDHFYMLTGFNLDVALWERPVAAAIPADPGEAPAG
jgi:hypothetical protein